MKRLVVAAALAAGSLLVHPLDAAAQYEPGTKNADLLCGYLSWFSYASIQNRNNADRSLYRWKCCRAWGSEVAVGSIETEEARRDGPKG